MTLSAVLTLRACDFGSLKVRFYCMAWLVRITSLLGILKLRSFTGKPLEHVYQCCKPLNTKVVDYVSCLQEIKLLNNWIMRYNLKYNF